jgi:uncharacterized membrane protein YagU involved in acid resistance
MKKLSNALISAAVATVVLSVLMVMKGAMGLMPDVNVIHMLAAQMKSGPAMGWIAHLMIGVVGYGIAFHILSKAGFVAGDVARGIVLAVVGWLMMMVALMPMMGQGMFGLSMPSGMMVPVATLMLHIIFGWVLGLTYQRLAGSDAAA